MTGGISHDRLAADVIQIGREARKQIRTQI